MLAAAGDEAAAAGRAGAALAALVALLGFQAEGGDRSGLQTGQADGFAGLLAVAVGVVLDAAQGVVDLGDQLPLAVAGAQLQ